MDPCASYRYRGKEDDEPDLLKEQEGKVSEGKNEASCIAIRDHFLVRTYQTFQQLLSIKS